LLKLYFEAAEGTLNCCQHLWSATLCAKTSWTCRWYAQFAEAV